MSSNRRAVLAAYQTYLDAFMLSDEEAIRDCIVWPCTFLGNGSSESMDVYPYSPAELRRRKGWEVSTGMEIDVVAVSDQKAHVLLRNSERVRADGSLIEEISAFYAFTKTLDGWKIFAMSSIEFPA